MCNLIPLAQSLLPCEVTHSGAKVMGDKILPIIIIICVLEEVGLARKMLTARLWAEPQGGTLGLARTWAQIFDLCVLGCGTLDESLHLSELQSWSNTKE